MINIRSLEWLSDNGFERDEVEENIALTELAFSKIQGNNWYGSKQARAIIIGLVPFVTTEELIEVLTSAGVRI